MELAPAQTPLTIGMDVCVVTNRKQSAMLAISVGLMFDPVYDTMQDFISQIGKKRTTQGKATEGFHNSKD